MTFWWRKKYLWISLKFRSEFYNHTICAFTWVSNHWPGPFSQLHIATALVLTRRDQNDHLLSWLYYFRLATKQDSISRSSDALCFIKFRNRAAAVAAHSYQAKQDSNFVESLLAVNCSYWPPIWKKEKWCVYFPEEAVIPAFTEKIKKKSKKSKETKKQKNRQKMIQRARLAKNLNFYISLPGKHGIRSANTLVQGKYQAFRVNSSVFSKYRFKTFSVIWTAKRIKNWV